jgi:hypothetical protein
MPAAADWIVYAADPLRPRGRPPAGAASLDLNEVIRQAELHGVLGALTENWPWRPESAKWRDIARHRHLTHAAFSRALTRHADALMAQIGHLPAAIVKGPVFARTIYPAASLRCFADIDILVAPSAVEAVHAALADNGFVLNAVNEHSEPREWKWLHGRNSSLMVEVQTDLIHADSLRSALSVTYELIADGPERPAALLFVALAHGAAHHYERLQHVVDVCQAARGLCGVEEEQRLEQLVKGAGAQFMAVTGLSVAGRLLNEPRCIELSRAIGPARNAGLAALLLDKAMVMSTMSHRRSRHGWRRQIYRWLLKRSTNGSR